MVSFPKILLKNIKKTTKLKPVDQLVYLKRLHHLLKNGYPIIRALEIIKWEKKFELTSETLSIEILKGNPLDIAFSVCHFHSSVISFMYFTRVNNNIEDSIFKSIQMFEHRIENITRFQKVMKYPIFLSVFFLLVFAFLQFYVFPSFTELFQTMNQTNSQFETSIKLFNTMSVLFMLLVLVSLIFYFVFHYYKKKLNIEQLINIQKRIPIIRYLTKIQTTYYFTTHLAMFLNAGLSLKEALMHLEKQETLKFIAFYSENMRAELERGINIDQLIESVFFIDNQVAVIFRQNISTASLEKDLFIYSELLQENFQNKIQTSFKVIQPVFLMIIASLIIMAYMSLMLPMLQMLQTI